MNYKIIKLFSMVFSLVFSLQSMQSDINIGDRVYVKRPEYTSARIYPIIIDEKFVNSLFVDMYSFNPGIGKVIRVLNLFDNTKLFKIKLKGQNSSVYLELRDIVRVV